MTIEKSPGNIVTFYSFKGGVGRTMALANVALLTAMNGKRVLIMDWDLEAPGLSYYFRGLLEAPAYKAMEDTPGILDLLYQWQSGVTHASDDTELAQLQQQFESGQVFERCVQSLVDPAMAKSCFPADMRLDILGPGARVIQSSEKLSYEEALAQFSWADFFEKHAGGFALEQLRHWAKEHYDFILIDSRTGLADIAGVCTMQLPDTVALCFVLNQQNIDGIAKVASAIHARRPGEIAIRAVPMRVSQRDSAESSDAQARALSALRAASGLATDTLRNDLNKLAIPLVDHLPFSEMLAPFAAPDPKFDPLTLRYIQLANHLLDFSLIMPPFSDDLLRRVRKPYLPKSATVEYVRSLAEAEPARAWAELEPLLENALMTIHDEMDIEYLAVLVTTCTKRLASDEPTLENAIQQVRRIKILTKLQEFAMKLVGTSTSDLDIDDVAQP